MIGTMILAHALPLWQAVSPDLQQAIQEEVQQEIRRGRFRGGFGAGAGFVGAFVPIALFAMIVLIVFIAARRRQAEIRARAEFQKQVLDKFSSGKEFAEFLGTEASQRFLAALTIPAMGARYRVLRTMRGGIIVTVLGFGFLVLTGIRHGFIVPGVLLLALGVGLLISAAASYYLSKKLSGAGPATPGPPLSST
ncbi:MAG TPA: hypothetical protein VFB23_04265 [Candidatus Acidoferrales bacterium]|jgi:hypothetical protein|nr:hypothetical protein [Candidatus Acidoferrales bacterium]